MTDVTLIMWWIESSDPNAPERSLPLVCDELRTLAAASLAQEKLGQRLQAMLLMHEAHLRPVDVDKAQPWNGCRHFFSAAAESMRRILIEGAQRKDQVKVRTFAPSALWHRNADRPASQGEINIDERRT